MIPGLKLEIENALAKACRDLFQIGLPRVVLETPPKVELGDIALPVGFDLAKVLKKAPKVIAEQISAALELPPIVSKRTVQGGYINLFLERGLALRAMLVDQPAQTSPLGKLIIEHTNINPNKAAHIGHLRNAVLGDILVKVFRRVGREVEVQNYLDDTGVQVADVVLGLRHPEDLLEPQRAEELAAEIRTILEAFPDHAPGIEPRRLGDLTWDLYGLVGKSYAADKTLEERRRATLHTIEAAALGNPLSPEETETARLASRLSECVVRCHLHTMERIGVDYDVLPRESDILALRFWSTAFEVLKAAKAIHLESEGKNAGCWVMGLEGSKEFEGMEDADKVLVRSNGTVTYTGKDIAYQLWKLGVLGKDFEFEEVPYLDVDGSPEFHGTDGTSPLYRSRRDGVGADPAARGRFGKAASVINVIDVRQSYPQKVVKEGVRRAGFGEQADRSVHFAYEMVALSPASAQALGLELSDEDKARSFVEMSGRKGLGVKAEDLLDELVEKARAEASRRLQKGEQLEPGQAESIAVGALRVYMARFSRNKVIAFDFDEAIAFEGDTGPYLQYAAVRTASIFRKLKDNDLPGHLDAAEKSRLHTLAAEHLDDGLWDVVRTCGRTLETIEKVAETLEVSLLVRHALAIAAGFHHFFHTHPILHAESVDSRLARRAALELVERHLADVLSVLGVPIPERM